MLVKIGTYSGNGADNRAITGIGFQPDLVIIKGDTTQVAVWRSASITGDNSLNFSNSALTANWIQSLDSDGFTIGTDARVNSNGINYYYIAIKKETNDPDFNFGSYTGDGTDNRNITGMGFQPTLVVVKRASGTAVYFDNNDNDTTGSHIFIPSSGSNRIQALQSDGFQIGSNVDVNFNSVSYYWFAFRAVSGRIATGSYTGNGIDNRNITGVGFQPSLVWIGYYGVLDTLEDTNFRTSSISGDNSFGFTQASALAINLIQSLLSDGFQIGTNNNVNLNNEPYHWFALAETTTSTSTSTSSSTSSSTSTTSTSSSTSTTSTSSSTSTSTTSTLTSTSSSTTSTSTSTTSTSTSTTSTSTSTSSSTSTSTTTTWPLKFTIDDGTRF